MTLIPSKEIWHSKVLQIYQIHRSGHRLAGFYWWCWWSWLVLRFVQLILSIMQFNSQHIMLASTNLTFWLLNPENFPHLWLRIILFLRLIKIKFNLIKKKIDKKIKTPIEDTFKIVILLLLYVWYYYYYYLFTCSD